MVSKRFCELKKVIRKLAKRNKIIKYSFEVLLLFLMSGSLLYSNNLLLENQYQVNVTNNINVISDLNEKIDSKELEINNTISDIEKQFRIAKKENDKLIKDANLKLTQLMEQGDQVIKSTWNSWQFGMNYFYNSWNGVYKGYGDKPEKYYFNNVFTRYNWKLRNARNVSFNLTSVNSAPITRGNEDTTSWSNSNSGASGTSFDINKYRSIYSSINGYNNWGLVNVKDIEKNISTIEILAKINSKEIEKIFTPITVNEPTTAPVNPIAVDPTVPDPIAPPKITQPTVEKINITPLSIDEPKLPNDSTPEGPNPIKVELLTVNSPSDPGPLEINIPKISPVDFTISPTGDSLLYKKTTWSGIPSVINVTELSNRNYVTISTPNSTINIPSTQIINVVSSNNRALVVDEARNGAVVNYSGTINLQKSQNVGIDLQGTHGGTATSPWILTVNNSGTIIGESKSGNDINENHIAFGFNNADASSNTTMSHMINSKTITLNAKNSAAIQLKPEDPYYWWPITWNAAPLKIEEDKRTNKEMGRVLMKAENKGNINLNSLGSFGILTVFNKGVKADDSDNNLLSGRLYDGVLITPGGEIGRSALSEYTSGIYNTGDGEINITGDNSIGIGLLQEIQEVKIGGTINIGNNSSISQENGISNTGSDLTKVERAVGVFAGVPTWPVKTGETDTLISDSSTQGNTATQLVGTETVEITGTINIEGNATNSIGALVGFTEVSLNEGLENGNQKKKRTYKRSGDITIKSDGILEIKGNNNYGLVVNNNSYSSKFPDASNPDNMISTISKSESGRGINEGNINVQGKENVGFYLKKGGNSENKGTINIKGGTSSVGFYGEEDQFTNSGTIKITTNTSDKKSKNRAVFLNGTNNSNKIVFINTGDIEVNKEVNTDGESNIGVYGTGNYEFNHNRGNIYIGSDSIGLYLSGENGVANIKSSINLAESKDSTTIGFYSDGNSKITFYSVSSIDIGKGAVGLYSADVSKFTNTFKINGGDTLNVTLGEKSTFALFDGKGSATSVPLSDYLNNNPNNKVNITSMGTGASLFYAKSNAEAVLDGDYTVTNGKNDSTAVLVAADSGIVTIDTGKTLTTNTKVGLVAVNSSTANNRGTLIPTRDEGIGLFAESATANNVGGGQ